MKILQLQILLKSKIQKYYRELLLDEFVEIVIKSDIEEQKAEETKQFEMQHVVNVPMVKNDNEKTTIDSDDDDIEIEFTPTLSMQQELSKSNQSQQTKPKHQKRRSTMKIHKNETKLPMIKFDNPDNVLGWYYMRQLLSNFGLRFRHRLNIFASIIILFSGLLILINVITIVGSSATNNGTTIDTTRNPFFLESMVAITLTFIFLYVLSKTGSAVNDNLDEHW